ncbi:S100P-binding protein isoform X2 [Hemicordylus capensis]|uniref:S100P-binding protein isoform X2 n=1 Tax=Hemicordylus capensis TaxID=884348 RepID=UPI00230262AA|nr:S100P-binding protein isoform X2 [Hemicordylus capensis]XP_053123744.1 S100P-binding protein isoform X2 [Hemicordylus capensis]
MASSSFRSCHFRPRPASKICIQEADLELHKRNYVNAVRAHVAFDNGKLVGATNELYALMGRVASEFRSQEPGFVHPTDLTMRNYAERTNQPTKRYTLSQWVERNQRNHRRFEDPQFLHFKRSPIPGL